MDTDARLALVAGDGNPKLAQEIARALEFPLLQASITAFADGETRVRIEAGVLGADVYLVQPTAAPVNERLMSLALLADAARGAGADRITALLPYFGYARQDVRKYPGEPRSARLAARILSVAGVDRAAVLELHSPALESAFDMPLLHLKADEVLLTAVRDWAIADLMLVSPDAGGPKRVQRYAAALGTEFAVVGKARPESDATVALQVLGDVRKRNCLIVDDIASTGRTIAGAAQALIAAGASEVNALFIHAVMVPGSLERICAAPVQRVVTTDSVPFAPNERIQVVSVAPLFASAVRRLAGLAEIWC